MHAYSCDLCVSVCVHVCVHVCACAWLGINGQTYVFLCTVSFEQSHSTLNAIKCIHNIKESISLKTALCRIPVYHAKKVEYLYFLCYLLLETHLYAYGKSEKRSWTELSNRGNC